MRSFLKFLLVIASITIASCGREKKETSKDLSEIINDKKQLKASNLMNAEKLAKSYNANIGWDRTENFTYSFQESLEFDRRPIAFYGEIRDVIKKDSLYILKVFNTHSNSIQYFLAEIPVNANTFQLLKAKLNPKEINYGCFIFQVTKVSSSLPILKSEVESNGDNVENASSFLTLDFDEPLITLQGKLITYFLYDRLKEDHE